MNYPRLKSFVLQSKLCFVLLLGSVSVVQAQGLNTDQVQWHGFVSQGLIQAPQTNFVNLDDTISSELTDLGVNMSWALTDKLRLAGQVVYLDGGQRYVKGTRLDYLFIDWTTKTRQSLKRVSLALNLKMARILRTGLNLQKQKRHRSMKAGILFGEK